MSTPPIVSILEGAPNTEYKFIVQDNLPVVVTNNEGEVTQYNLVAINPDDIARFLANPDDAEIAPNIKRVAKLIDEINADQDQDTRNDFHLFNRHYVNPQSYFETQRSKGCEVHVLLDLDEKIIGLLNVGMRIENENGAMVNGDADIHNLEIVEISYFITSQNLRKGIGRQMVRSAVISALRNHPESKESSRFVLFEVDKNNTNSQFFAQNQVNFFNDQQNLEIGIAGYRITPSQCKINPLARISPDTDDYLYLFHTRD